MKTSTHYVRKCVWTGSIPAWGALQEGAAVLLPFYIILILLDL